MYCASSKIDKTRPVSAPPRHPRATAGTPDAPRHPLVSILELWRIGSAVGAAASSNDDRQINPRVLSRVLIETPSFLQCILAEVTDSITTNGNINNKDLVVWLTTGTTHIARAEEWPIMPTEWVNVLLKPWNYFDETPTLNRH